MKKGGKKKVPSKKTGAKKSTAQMAALKHRPSQKKGGSRRPLQGARMNQLWNELKKLSGALGEEDLNTLIQQAKILAHNREVLNSMSKLKSATQKRLGIGKDRESLELKVKVREAADLSYFFIDFYGYENFFTRDEMRKIVKMCNASADGVDAGRRLFSWFKNERSDVLKNTSLSRANDPILKMIYDYIIQSYSVKS